jgi:hypothetical protein
VRASRSYRLLVRRGGRGPSWLAGPDRVDHLEIVDIDSGEVVLFWDAVPRDAGQMARAIRSDLQTLEADDFIERWSAQS